MDQVSLPTQDSIHAIREIARDLTHLNSPLAVSAIPAISTRRVDSSMKNSTTNRRKPGLVHTSTAKISVATISSQCRPKNSFQVVFRIRTGAGSTPRRSKMPAIVCERIAPEVGQRAFDPTIAASRGFSSASLTIYKVVVKR